MSAADSTETTRAPIDACLERWHAYIRGEVPGGLDDLLDDSVVFTSPIVFRPQEGKELTKLYLTAAANTFGGDESEAGGATSGGGFRYVRSVREGHDAVLEFETTMGGKYVNGVDMIRCNDEGRIVDFKVMVRPLQAVNAVHERMRAMLESLA
jgi:hypothetical protein